MKRAIFVALTLTATAFSGCTAQEPVEDLSAPVATTPAVASPVATPLSGSDQMRAEFAQQEAAEDNRYQDNVIAVMRMLSNPPPSSTLSDYIAARATLEQAQAQLFQILPPTRWVKIHSLLESGISQSLTGMRLAEMGIQFNRSQEVQEAAVYLRQGAALMRQAEQEAKAVH